MNESTDTSTSTRSGSRAANLKQRIKQDGKEKIETGKRAAADQIAEIADAIDLAGAQLDQSQPTLANYATQLANSVGTFATRASALASAISFLANAIASSIKRVSRPATEPCSPLPDR